MVRRVAGGAAVGEVVTRHRRDHGVGQAESLDRGGHPLGLVGVGGLGMSGVDEAEPAGAGAALAVDHERGRAVGPALEDVGAARFLAHRDEPEVAHGPPQAEELLAHAGRDPQPRRLAGVGGEPGTGVDTGLAQPDAQPLARHPLRQWARPDRRRTVAAGVRRSVAGVGTAGEVDTAGRRESARPRPGVRTPVRRPAAHGVADEDDRPTSCMGTSTPSAASDVTGLVGAIPHGTMRSNHARSGSTLRASPCSGATRA